MEVATRQGNRGQVESMKTSLPLGWQRSARATLVALVAGSITLVAAPGAAQLQTRSLSQAADEQDLPAPAPTLAPVRPGRIGDSPVGEIGQRQTRDRPPAGVEPLARFNGRIANRVESRLRNRIDPYYDPQANATSPFLSASDQARVAGQRR